MSATVEKMSSFQHVTADHTGAFGNLIAKRLIAAGLFRLPPRLRVMLPLEIDGLARRILLEAPFVGRTRNVAG